MKVISFFIGLCLWSWSFFAVAGTLEDIRLSNYRSNVVRLVLDLSDKTDVSVFRLSSPARLVIDAKKTRFSKKARQKKGQSIGFISGLRLGQPDSQTARVVLDLPPQTLKESHFLLPPQGANTKWRFVMDISSDVPPALPTQSNKKADISQNTSRALQPFSKKTQKIIMLDPGHGGADPGAISKNGHYEKDLTLKMALETKKLLEKEGYKVVLTRDRDIFISLRGRIEKAHRANADLFISIHADSAKNTSARGLSVYTISENASDKEAAALAERENKADIILGMDLVEYQPEVGNILIDLAKRETMDKSAVYATHVVNEMKKNIKLVPNAHRFAGFVVLKSPNIPSVLVELGYLSNRSEERQLQKASYRRELGQALVRAVNRYFKEFN